MDNNETVKVIDQTIPKEYNGGYPAGLTEKEFSAIRPDVQPRRKDWIFHYSRPVDIPIDFAKALVIKFPKRFKIVDVKGKPYEIVDDLDSLTWGELQKINSELVMKMKEMLVPDTFKIAGLKRSDLEQQIRTMRAKLPVEPEKPEESQNE